MLKIGIVSETHVQQYYLKHVVEESGYQSECCLLVAEFSDKDKPMTLSSVDAWLIDVDIERLDGYLLRHFEDWLSGIEAPIIFSEGNTYNAAEADFISWSRQLNIKLLNLKGQLQLLRRNKVKAANIWVLAASTGGPEVVKRFLDRVDKDLDVGFIYVQHIDQMQYQVLSETVCRDSHYTGLIASHGEVVCSKTVMVIPADKLVELQSNGTMIVHQDRPWRGVYSPSIDQVVANVADVYGAASGVIFFTGMGDDGTAGCRLMSLRGGQVWVQSPSSCTVESMPKSVIDTGCAAKVDTPESLAIHLNVALKNSAATITEK
ncbi:hypothetical protein AB835_02945 [Candidatus Endobugula sertula]|uniref:protein-glutamate methylesterase n=1 Tax=Candidatus Endobugula sertula TaxID=62101 RepID=A0A1D2QSL2_9GAMM|nr:hypothetical protein AB835_02945 [Candidatus Endobugula sertula]